MMDNFEQGLLTLLQEVREQKNTEDNQNDLEFAKLLP